MKVEQRIGRIDRIGQRYDTIYVLNLCYVDSAEHIVYGRLLTRLMEAGAVVGTQQVSLLPVTRDEFQQLAEGQLSEKALEATARQRCEEMQRRTRSMEISPNDLYAMYSRQAEHLSKERPPVDMETIWETISTSWYLRDRGCVVMPDVERQAMIVAKIPDVVDGTLLTTSRETFERGLPDSLISSRFATYGEPVFDRIVEMFNAFDLPACTRRITAPLPGSGAELIGYAVTCFDEAGISSCRLITSLHDLAHMRINEEGVVTEEDAERLHDELVHLESASIPVSRIEQINLAAARHQLLLDYLIINGLLSSRKHIGLGDPLFWREITALEQIGEDTCRREGSLRIPRIPVLTARRITPDLLFDLALPTMGNEGYMDAPAPLIRAAVESAMRLADGMHVARGTLTVDSFLNHLEKEIPKL